MGIEPTLSAWEAEVLPLNYTRVGAQRLTGCGPLAWTRSRRDRPAAACTFVQLPRPGLSFKMGCIVMSRCGKRST